MKRSATIIMSFIFVLLTACGGPAASQGISVPGSGDGYTKISVPELQTMLENKDFVMINVHIPFEGNLPGTDGSIPYDRIADNIDQLPVDKDAKIVIYCRSGSMSSKAAKDLVELGFTNVYDLQGGFNAWKAVDLPMEGE